ncbi:MAG: carboxylating nicotinate-nucleotide diphosphorylase [Alphaproteobacteria bacterium]
MKIAKLIKKTLQEDHYQKDITSVTLPDKLKVEAKIIAKAPGIVCGLNIAKQVFQIVDRKLRITILKNDGDKICGKTVKETVVKITGKAKSILAAERVALNFLQHLSGVSTVTNQFVKTLNNPKIKIRDTRKTLPLLRKLQKYAVKIGGGKNQRKNLADQVLFKDNHWICLEKTEISFSKYLQILRKKLTRNKKLKKNKPIYIQVEANNLEEVKKVLEVEPNLILLDNMNPKQAAEAIKLIGKKSKIEISGGITLKNIADYKDLEIDYISIGALTHSVKALDFSLEIL